LTHRAIGWDLLPKVISIPRLQIDRQKLADADNRRLPELSRRLTWTG